MDKTVSIIIPVYNLEEHLKNLFKSIESQENINGFEFIFIDDGSEDNSLKILKEYAENKPFIKIFSGSNKGVSFVRNKGLDNATGDYILFIDGDDIIDKDYCSTIRNKLKNFDGDCFFFGMDEINNSDKTISKFPQTCYYKGIITDKVLSDFLRRKILIKIFAICVKKELIEKNDIRFDEDTKYGEDLFFIWKVLLNLKEIDCIEKSLYYYIKGVKNSAMTKKTKLSRFDSYYFAREMCPYVEEKRPSFYEEFKKFAPARELFSCFRALIKSNNKKLYKQMTKDTEIMKYYNNLLSYPDILIKFSAIFIKIPSLYYFMMRIIDRF